MELFKRTDTGNHEPLAYRMRPRTLDEFVGQEAIIGKGRLLRRIIQADQLSSVIFYGPPGTGKTTLARVIAGTTKSHFITMNAVLSGVKDLREALADAKDKKDLYGRRTILFIDEVHRWNKSQQDALLPWVENGTIIMIGATTENPYFEVNPALVSRSRIFQLLPLEKEDLRAIAENTLSDRDRGYGKYRVEFEEEALEHIVTIANGDARSLLNALELAVETTPDTFPPPDEGVPIRVTLEAAEESIQKKVVLYDKEGDYHFDTISAFIKSIRGSDPDAALYWLARMVAAGENPRFIFRRMLILACEDVGLADPAALGVVEAAAAAFDRVGMPEGRYHLTHATLYLANTLKSNSSMGFFDALKRVESERDGQIPRHLKDANRDSKSLGHGEGYLYPHAYRDHWVAQDYLPGGLSGISFYTPGELGWEKGIGERLRRQRELLTETSADSVEPDVLSFTPSDGTFDHFFRRFVDNREKELSEIREKVFTRLNPARTDRLLVCTPVNTSLIWEALRRSPEGGVWVLTTDEQSAQQITDFSSSLPEDRCPSGVLTPEQFPEGLEKGMQFENVILKDWFTRTGNPASFLTSIKRLLTAGCSCACIQVIPGEGTRLSDFLEPGKAAETLKAAENSLYREDGLFITAEMLEHSITESGFTDYNFETIESVRTMYVSERTLDSWFDGEKRDNYGNLLRGTLSRAQAAVVETGLRGILTNARVPWKREIILITARSGW